MVLPDRLSDVIGSWGAKAAESELAGGGAGEGVTCCAAVCPLLLA